MFLWELLWLPGFKLVILHSKVGNAVIHDEADRALGVNGVVVPLKINAGVQFSLPVLGDFLVFC